MPWKMSSLASAATSTTLPIFVPSFVTTASPVLTAVHAICSSAMRRIIEPVQLRGLDGCGLAEDEQEDGLASETLGLMVHRDRATAPRHHERCCCPQGEARSGGTLLGHRLRGCGVEGEPAFLELAFQGIAGEQ